eukprot:5639029-Alexandrium_andersonii.AAC.1
MGWGRKKRLRSLRNAWRRTMWLKWAGESLGRDAGLARTTGATWQHAAFTAASRLIRRKPQLANRLIAVLPGAGFSDARVGI